jgi:hypothetical protein
MSFLMTLSRLENKALRAVKIVGRLEKVKRALYRAMANIFVAIKG